MIGDENRQIREAVNRIIDSRRFKSANENVRKFKIPKFHFDATEYFNLIGWDHFSEPPLTMDSSIKELLEIVKKEIPSCHSQAVKRAGKIVSETRDGLIIVKLNIARKKNLFQDDIFTVVPYL
jgi:hypothetical protein